MDNQLLKLLFCFAILDRQFFVYLFSEIIRFCSNNFFDQKKYLNLMAEIVDIFLPIFLLTNDFN